MEDFEVEAAGERFRIAERHAEGPVPTYDIAWLSAPGEGSRGLTLGGTGLTRELLIGEAVAYAQAERRRSDDPTDR
jgi:hypothetical protein